MIELAPEKWDRRPSGVDAACLTELAGYVQRQD